MMDKHLLELAEAQLIGFAHASKGYSIKDLVMSMGLTKDEWLKIRDNAYLKPYDKQIIDELFKTEQKNDG